MLFFQEAFQSLESIFYGFLLHQLWSRLSRIIHCVTPPFIQYINPEKKIYIIGARVYTMGITYLESSSLLRIARPYLMLLADKYEKTTFIAKRSKDRAFCIYKYVSLYSKVHTGTVGDPKRLHSTAIGKCFLAFDAGAAPLIPWGLIPRPLGRLKTEWK